MITLAFYNNEQKQKIIFEAYQNPQYKKDKIIETNKTIKEHSLVCVDDIKINFEFENDYLKNVEYEATGCAIFLSSVEIMIKENINKTKKQIQNILETYFKMINSTELNENEADLLNKLTVFQNVKVHLNRLECASIIYRSFKKGLENE
ncbi:iron-sulfur cluster assembly scaffold protein [Mycoplasma struthionis]|uniref:iron-sulfur cluster assembly scaffold protein n=1 Tax=Mycoplasma struthionis TaxID=538220 RepID=UPI0021BDE021|nr:iron-sulfur cluster assembly scaffold protein [Mycoplasma struthionis]